MKKGASDYRVDKDGNFQRNENGDMIRKPAIRYDKMSSTGMKGKDNAMMKKAKASAIAMLVRKSKATKIPKSPTN